MGEIQAQPLVADINNDGELEVFVGEGLEGRVGGRRGRRGAAGAVPGEPFHLVDFTPPRRLLIRRPPLLLLLPSPLPTHTHAADMRGNLAAFSPKGEEVWERHVHSAVSQGAVAGDVDGDGQLEVRGGGRRWEHGGAVSQRFVESRFLLWPSSSRNAL